MTGNDRASTSPSGTVGIFDGDRLVAYAEVAGDRGDAAVDPEYRGRGIGTALAAWTQAKARSNGATEVGMPVPEGSPGDRLLDALGYRVRWTSWVLKLPEGRTIEARTLPAGYVDPRGRCRRSTATSGPWSRTPSSSGHCASARRFEDFAATVTERPGFEPWNLRVVVDPTGAVVGASTCCSPAPRRPTCPSSPCARTNVGAASPKRYWSTPLPRRASASRRHGVGALHGFPHRRSRPLYQRRHGAHLGVGQPRDRPVRTVLGDGAQPCIGRELARQLSHAVTAVRRDRPTTSRGTANCRAEPCV